MDRTFHMQSYAPQVNNFPPGSVADTGMPPHAQSEDQLSNSKVRIRS